jgi:hypothetical protein
MTLSSYALPFGLRDVKITPYNGDVLGSAVDLPASRTFSFAESEAFEELRGDDSAIASHGAGPAVDWSLEAGGISLAAYVVLAGGAVFSSGVSPNEKKVYVKKGTDARPYFKVEGQVISDSGGDVHCVVFKCKAEGDIGGEFSEGSFFLTSCSGRGYVNSEGNLYEFVHNETAVAAS